LQFSWESLDGARNARKALLDRIRALRDKAGNAKNTGTGAVSDIDGESGVGAYLKAFDRAIEDDLSTPRALAELWGLLRDTKTESSKALAAVFDMDSILGLNLKADVEGSAELPADLMQEIKELIAQRNAAKKAKDFERADAIRQSLKNKGIILEDSPNGTRWRRS
jgi:cysteinyl-tRNA synthetase